MPSRRRFLSFLGWLALGLSAPLACAPTAEPPPSALPDDTPRTTGLSLTLRIDDESDVSDMRFVITRESCHGEPVDPYSLLFDKALEDILLPGGIHELEDDPLDGDSSHRFADVFVTLPEGCYSVTTQPLTHDSGYSEDCLPAFTPSVRVVDGQTTEVLLLNQCRGDGRGAIDVISALNHPPELVSLVFQDSKFVLQCTDQLLCATVKDPDKDPLELTWTQAGGPALFKGPEVVSTTENADGSLTQCVRAVADEPGKHELTLTLYDLLHHPATRALMRVEDYLREKGTPFPSNDTLDFFFYAAGDGRVGGCTRPATSCKALLEREPGLPSGLYALDVDGESGPLAPYEAWCDMTTQGGGWTLVMVSSDDSQDTWTWDSRTRMTTDTAPIGDVHARNKDFKSPALHQVAFRDLLFVHAPSSEWAAYEGVGSGSTDVGRFMAALEAPVCDPSLGDNGYPLTAGTLSTRGWLCDTDLYFHLGDFDGTEDARYCQGDTGFQDSTYGPAWNIRFNHACPFDEPAYASTGPALSYKDLEAPGMGFGEALGLNTGTQGLGENYLQMYVR